MTKDSPFDLSFINKAAPHQDWYLRIRPKAKRLSKQVENDPERKAQLKKAVRLEFERLLASDELFLGGKESSLDQERKPIDTIIIHHTSTDPGITLNRINATHLLNIYIPYFQNPTLEEEKWLKGSPITSNHLVDGKPVFYAYHWLVRMDGSIKRLLPDSALAWHAGNWDINCRSVAICLDNDYEDQDPSPETLDTLAKLIKENYPGIKLESIKGHGEVKKNGETICPGSNFENWKQELFAKLPQPS